MGGGGLAKMMTATYAFENRQFVIDEQQKMDTMLL